MGNIVGTFTVFDGTEAVGGTNTVSNGIYTTDAKGEFAKSMVRLDRPGTFAIFAQATSNGTTTLQVQCITNFTDSLSTAVVPEGMSDIINLDDEDVHHVGFAPPVTPFMGIKVTGSGSNDATTVVKIVLVFWES
uniref:Uncharacterized protein n=1 Tax=viral metagenome TaxID=1070528 RepID=A0A6H2A551_9ZZZZ